MKTRFCLASAALACALPLSLSAQWFHYPTPGVPRTASGAPDLKARAPRTAAGKPDLSGMWLNKETLPCPPVLRGDNGDCAEKTGLPVQAPNIAAGMEGGLPYQPWAAELIQKRKQDLGRDDPHAHCLPAGFPRAYGLPHIEKFIQNPGLLVILDEFNANYRQIFTDGRALPVDPQPSWNGYSSGKWEGDTLVVKTNGLRDDLWLDMAGSPLTNAATMTERFHRPDYGHLNVEVTVDDPKAYTKPWTVTFHLSIVLDTELVDEICAENEKSVSHLK